MTTTPYDARRAMRLREASEAVYHLAHVVKDYPNVRKDGFGASHLARIEKVLTETSAVVAEMIESERDLNTSKPVELVVAFDSDAIAASYPSRAIDPEKLRTMETTIPASLLERIAARHACGDGEDCGDGMDCGDCD